MFEVCEVPHHIPWVEKSGQNTVQGQDKNRSYEVKSGLPSKEVAPTCGKQVSRGDLTANHTVKQI
eukprot:14941016-Heterocapsa_arctica.AAC.1